MRSTVAISSTGRLLALLVDSVLHLARTICRALLAISCLTPVHAVLTDPRRRVGHRPTRIDGGERARGRRPRNHVDTAIRPLWQQRSGARDIVQACRDHNG